MKLINIIALPVVLFGCQKNTYVMNSTATFDHVTVETSITPATKDSSWVTLIVTNDSDNDKKFVANKFMYKWSDHADTLNITNFAPVNCDSLTIRRDGKYLMPKSTITIKRLIENKFTDHTCIALRHFALQLSDGDANDTTEYAARHQDIDILSGCYLVSHRDFNGELLFKDRLRNPYLEATIAAHRKADGSVLLIVEMKNESDSIPVATGFELHPVWNKAKNELLLQLLPQKYTTEADQKKELIQPGAVKIFRDSVPDYFDAHTAIAFSNVHYLVRAKPEYCACLLPFAVDPDRFELEAKFNMYRE